MTEIKIDFSPENGIANVYGQSMLFHCNHYNRSLQQVIEDADYLDLDKILIKSAAEVVYLQLSEYYKENPNLSFREKADFAAEMFKFAGFGILDFSDLNENGGKVIGKSSHYGLSSKLNFGNRKSPAEFFDKGFILGAVSAIKGSLSGSLFDEDLTISQSKSISLGDDYCAYEVKSSLKTVENKLPEFVSIPPRKFETGVDENGIVSALAGMPLVGDEEGLIPAFGVYLTRMYADYYNKISYRFEQQITKAMGSHELATQMLVEAGHICAFHTFGGIMKSDEWKALIKPMLQNREDWIHGIVAVVNALGWGVWRVEELIPGEKLVIRAYQDYESLGYLKWFGKAEHHISYLMTGGCAGLMNLLYLGDITTEPELDKKYYYELFNDQNCFKGVQTKCLAMGDDYSEVVVTK